MVRLACWPKLTVPPVSLALPPTHTPAAVVTEVLADACRSLAPFLAEASARGTPAVPFDTATLRHRLEVIPALLHLATRAALDNAADLGLPEAQAEGAWSASAGGAVKPEVIRGQ